MKQRINFNLIVRQILDDIDKSYTFTYKTNQSDFEKYLIDLFNHSDYMYQLQNKFNKDCFYYVAYLVKPLITNHLLINGNKRLIIASIVNLVKVFNYGLINYNSQSVINLITKSQNNLDTQTLLYNINLFIIHNFKLNTKTDNEKYNILINELARQ